MGKAGMIFFDIDGTLVDHKGAERAAAFSFQRDFAKIFPGPPDEFASRWQTLAEKHVRRYLAGELSFQDQRRARIRELFALEGSVADNEADSIFSVYLKRYEQNWRLFADVESCLTDIAGHGLGIISNGDSKQQRAKLQVLGIAERFSTVLISGDIGKAKPETGIFVLACQNAGKRPDECLYVGDDFEVDAMASRRAGMRGIWLNRTGMDRPSRNDMIRSLTELVNQIGSHNNLPQSPPRAAG
jgi:putative hydrolase of the HAD superfamily